MKHVYPTKKFYNRLNDEYITENDYQHANHVWNAFNIKTLGEYSDLYVKTDVLLLSDIFENFRSVCMKAYNLDPVWYYTAPGLSWDSMLKFTKVKIELLMDYDMYLFIEKGIRGGISQCSNRYARANNKFLPNFEPSKPQNFLLYLDANNLYGWAMSQYLPLNDFTWVDFLDVDNIDENGEKGYILEVDLKYPESLHDDHSDLPLAPESSVPPDVKKRLLTTLYPKTNYVAHIRNLKQYLKLGLVLKKVHKILEFHQESWLQPYINMNTQFRTEAENEFEKKFYKLMNNAIFGKTMENIRKRVYIRLCNNGEKAEKLISKPNFKGPFSVRIWQLFIWVKYH
ncbi:c2H2-type domain-containing protein [Trichonephila clavipes]|nr:c2H2-type domain-containing protein [Trichonephila clavipes]